MSVKPTINKEDLMKAGATDEEALRRLMNVITVLRAPGGCPWDRVQTHETLIRPMIEEAYEVVEAIEKKDDANLREELGDVLLQVVFHADIAREEDRFTIKDIANEECEKMIRRHPHVFGDLENNMTPDGVLVKWEEIKKTEKKNQTQTESMMSIPRDLPALYRADKIQAKAKKVGFDWDDVSGAFDKIVEESQEVKEAVARGDKEEIFKEVGDLIFAAVNVARMLDVDPEEALNITSEKFIKRFSFVEKHMAEGMKLDELDKLWEEAKARERVLKAGLECNEKGLIQRTWGNISARLSENEFVITPSGRRYQDLKAEDLVKVTLQDNRCVYEEGLKPSTETMLHGLCYHLRPDCKFIIHTHQKAASAVGIGAEEFEFAAPVFYAEPGSKELCDAVEASVKNHLNQETFLLQNHGALLLGKNIDHAFELAENLEKSAEKQLAMEGEDAVMKAKDSIGVLKPYLDDFAMIIGEELDLSRDLKDVLQGVDADAKRLILEKNCMAALYAKEKGFSPMAEEVARKERECYLDSYSKRCDE